MTKLQQWMDKNGLDDGALAKLVKRSRPQISRIRRGVVGASVATARALERVTGIKWWHFVPGAAPEKRVK